MRYLLGRRWCWTVLAAIIAVGAPGTRSANAQGTLSALETDVDQIVRRARPAVVTVLAQRHVAHRPTSTGPSVRRLHTRVGTGVAVDESFILTTASVVLSSERVLVRTANGLQVEAELVGMDPIFNLALLSAPQVRLPVLRFAGGRSAQVGDWVISLGTSYRAQPTQSVGNIAYRYREPRQSLLQLTNAVYPGNSGAAALNARGELVGIVQGELGAPEIPGANNDGERRPGGMSMVMPVEIVRPVYESLRRDGRVRHGFLGVTTRAASIESDDAGGQRTPIGALVESVVPNGPAAQAGIRHGDLIVGFDRERVEYPEQLARWVAATPPSTSVELVWVRDEDEHRGPCDLAESPEVIPPWVAIGMEHDQVEPVAPSKISELEREIRRLSNELARLKEKGPQR